MHTLNLIAMGIGYASLCFTLVVVIACILCWFSGVTRPSDNAEHAAQRGPELLDYQKAYAKLAETNVRIVSTCRFRASGKSRLSLIPGGRQSR